MTTLLLAIDYNPKTNSQLNVVLPLVGVRLFLNIGNKWQWLLEPDSST